MSEVIVTDGVSLNEVVVRSFRSEDREQVVALHREDVADAICCGCDGRSGQTERVYGGRKHDHYWVAEHRGKVIGTLVLLLEAGEDVAHLHCLRVSSVWSDVMGVRRQLVAAAAAHARDHGSLKLVLHANVNDKSKAAAFLHRLGFEFSRHREVDGEAAMEFYLNLYQQPEIK